MTMPLEQFKDRFTRVDELLVMEIGLLRQIAARLGAPSGGDGGTPAPSDKAQRLRVATLQLGAANTETTWQLPPGINTFTLQSRGGNAVRMASQPGVVALSNDPYFTLKAGVVYSQDELDIALLQPAAVLYFSCSVANEVLELIIGE